MRKCLALLVGLLGLIKAQTALPATDAPKRVFIVPIAIRNSTKAR